MIGYHFPVATLIPYIAGSTASLAALHLDRIPALKPQAYDIADPKAVRFFDFIAVTNRYAFTGTTDMATGALSLPGWVLLDCYLLPSAVIGFAQRAADLPSEVYQALSPDDPTQLVPVSAYTAIPSNVPGRWVGVSLFSLVTGQRLGLRTKALALLLYGTTVQVGITQFDSSSIRIHTQLGPLKLAQTHPPIHTLSHKTFVYELEVPPPATLKVMATTDKPVVGPRVGTPTWHVMGDPLVVGELKAKVAANPGKYAIVYPGIQQGPRGAELFIASLDP